MRYTDQLVSLFSEAIQQDPEKEFDMVRMYNFTTFDVMGDLTFGEPLHMLDNAEYDPWVSVVCPLSCFDANFGRDKVRIIFSSIRVASKISILTNYPAVWRRFKSWVPETMNKRRMEHFNHSVTRVTKRLEKGRHTEGIDLWDLVLGQKEGKGLTRGEMDANASLFMIAGTETTATLVSGLTFYLLKNPRCMKKLVNEIRSTFASSDNMTMEQLAALPYLSACIKEAFRLYPPVPLSLPRKTPEDGSTICGEFVPPNTIVGIPQYPMNVNERNFKDPLEYIPERWLGDERYQNDEKHALQPFSVGSRDCVGKK